MPLGTLACALLCALLSGMSLRASAEAGWQLPVTAAFAPDGSLWRLRSDGERLFADRSTDLGATFSAPVPIDPEVRHLALSAEERAAIAFAGAAVHVAWPVAAGAGTTRMFHAVSTDAGRSFSAPQPLEPEPGRLHRFALDAAGAWQHFWYRDPAPGAPATLYSAAENTAQSAPTALATGLCDCCRPALAVTPDGQPVLAARFVYPGNIRDHGLIHPAANGTATVQRVTFDEWQVAACPVQGPVLAIDGGGRYQLAWFTLGAHRGLFRAHSDDAGAHFSTPESFGDPAAYAMNPALAVQGDRVALIWQEYRGGSIRIRAQRSADRGASWGPAQEIAAAPAPADRAELLVRGENFYLSWQTRDAYLLVPLAP